MLTTTDIDAGPESRDAHSLTDGLVSSAMLYEFDGPGPFRGDRAAR